jgi:hypothetical protein
VSVRTTAHLVSTGSFEDPQNARVIYLAAGGLVLLAVLLGVGTWWWWRNAKVEHPALAPLEVMGTRRWTKSDHPDQQRRLESARPAGDSIDDGDIVVAAEPVDLDHVLTRDDPSHFDELAEPVILADVASDADADADVVPVPSGPEESVESTDVAAPPAEPSVEPSSVEPSVEPDASDVGVEEAVDAPADLPLEVQVEVPDAAAVDGELEGSPMLSAAAVAVLDHAAPAAVAEGSTDDLVTVAPAPKPIVVIDTAPSPPSVTSAPSGEPQVADAVDHSDDHAGDDGDDTPTHIDPLLRSQAE